MVTLWILSQNPNGRVRLLTAKEAEAKGLLSCSDMEASGLSRQIPARLLERCVFQSTQEAMYTNHEKHCKATETKQQHFPVVDILPTGNSIEHAI